MVKRIVATAATLFCLSLVLFAGFAFAGLSSGAAQEKAGPVLGSDAGDANSLSQPLEVGSDSYWVFFFSIYSPQRLLVAVSDSTGDVVTDEGKLFRVGSAVYDYAVTEEFLKARGWGFDAVEPVLGASAGSISDQQRRLADFSAQTQSLYPELAPAFSKIDGALSRLSDQVIGAESVSRDGTALESQFASDYSSSSLDAVFKQYNTSLRSLDSLFKAHDEYVSALNNFSIELYTANVTTTDKSNIDTNLGVLKDDGLKELRDKFVSQRPQLDFARLLSARDRWVNDSIETGLYRKNRQAALDAVAAIDSPVDALLKNEAAVTACGVSSASISKLRKDWTDAHYFLSKETASGFVKALDKAAAVQGELTEISRAYQYCGAQPSVSSRSTTQQTDYSPLFAVALIALLAVAAFAYWKKKQEELQDYGNQ